MSARKRNGEAMHMRTQWYRSLALAAVLAAVSLGRPARGADRPYAEGPVVTVTSVRTATGMFDEYLAWLAGPWKQFMEAQKKAGLILDYKVYVIRPATVSDPDLYLEVTYKNWAAFDGLEAKLDPITEKVFGSRKKAETQAVMREQMRTVIGDQTMQELILK